MEIRDNLFHIGRQGGADIDHLVCQWMAEVEPRGVQGLPLYAREAAAVEVVAEERMAEVREVDADLMRAARVKHEVDEREMPVCLHGVVMRAGGLSVGRDFAQMMLGSARAIGASMSPSGGVSSPSINARYSRWKSLPSPRRGVSLY